MSIYAIRFSQVGLSALTLAMAVALAACSGPSNEAQATTDTVAIAAAPQKDFTMSASGLSQPDGTQVLLLGYVKDNKGAWTQGTLGTTTVQGGKFSLSGAASLPLPGALQIGQDGTSDVQLLPLIVEKASYQVRNDDGALVITGGRYNDLVFGFTQQPDFLATSRLKHAAEAKAVAGIDPSDQKAMLQAKIDSAGVVGPYYETLGKIANEYLAKIIDGNNDDLAKFYALMNNSDGERYPQAKRDALIQAFGKTLADNPEYKNSLVTAAAEAEAANIRETLVKGKPYRDITVADKDGKQVKLSDVLKKNKLVLLDFWASWCAPCREDFPYLAEVYREYHAAGFEIYAVSLDEDRDDWLKALKQESDSGHVPWINLRAQGFSAEAAMAYGVMGLPSSFLLGSDGIILGKDMHKQEIGKVVRTQLAKLDASKG